MLANMRSIPPSAWIAGAARTTVGLLASVSPAVSRTALAMLCAAASDHSPAARGCHPEYRTWQRSGEGRNRTGDTTIFRRIEDGAVRFLSVPLRQYRDVVASQMKVPGVAQFRPVLPTEIP